MAKRLRTEDALARVAELRRTADAGGQDVAGELRTLLRHRSNFVVAKATALVAELGLSDLAPELTEAFPYFMRDAVKRDPGCSTKLAIVIALSQFHEPAHTVFLDGVQHVQLEPAWGGPIDTAATLRAMCGRALIAFGHPDAFRWHAALLADSEPMTRRLAVETLGSVPDERTELLLRAKIARPVGERDSNSDVDMDAFDALMRIAPDESFEFVARYLHDTEAGRIHAAALAIGASHHADAFETLTACWRQSDNDTRTLFALPIALIRSEAAFEMLVRELAAAPAGLAESIVEALAIFREDVGRAGAVRAVVDSRGVPRLERCYARHFEPDEDA